MEKVIDFKNYVKDNKINYAVFEGPKESLQKKLASFSSDELMYFLAHQTDLICFIHGVLGART